mgnify:CR=1 FL=1
MKEPLTYDDVKQIVSDKMELQGERITLCFWMSGGALFMAFATMLVCVWCR